MLMALLKGKLSHEQEKMEDILTSNVFGLLKYLPAENGLLPFLSEAQTPDGVLPLADLPNGTRADYEFWPQWQRGNCAFCEPDVLVRLTLPDNSKKLVLVEAKLWSGKSAGADDQVGSVPPNDQLAKEWDNLTIYAQEEVAEPILVYLTADLGRPSEAIQESTAEVRLKRGSEATIAWLSWRHLEAFVAGTSDPLLRDLGAMLRKLTLFFFRGVSPIARVLPVDWGFTPRRVTYDYDVVRVGPIGWSFSR